MALLPDFLFNRSREFTSFPRDHYFLIEKSYSFSLESDIWGIRKVSYCRQEKPLFLYIFYRKAFICKFWGKKRDKTISDVLLKIEKDVGKRKEKPHRKAISFLQKKKYLISSADSSRFLGNVFITAYASRFLSPTRIRWKTSRKDLLRMSSLFGRWLFKN